MPTYEYVCKACGERLEVVQAFTDPSLTECPSCHGELKKVFGNVGIVFKGSGFYKTDSRSSSSAAVEPAATKSTESASAPSGTPASSADTAAPSSSGSSSSTPAAAVS